LEIFSGKYLKQFLLEKKIAVNNLLLFIEYTIDKLG